MNNNECKICGYIGTLGVGSLFSHIKRKHNLTKEEYFEKYLRVSETEGICEKCGNKTILLNDFHYSRFCGRKCASSYYSSKRWENPEFMYKMTEVARNRMKSFWEDDEFKERKSLLTKKQWENKEYREKMELFFNSENERTRRSKTSKEMWNNKEYKEMMGRLSSLRWSDPEYKKQVTERISEVMSSIYNEDKWMGWRSIGETELLYFIRSLKIEVLSNKCIELSEENVKSFGFTRMYPDISVGNKIIEYNGNYWHSLPERIDHDLKRYEVLRLMNYDLLIVWESEWYMNQDETKQRVVEFLND